jgi:hypothetical protein
VSIYNVKKIFLGTKRSGPPGTGKGRRGREGKGREGKGKEGSGTKGRRPQFFALGRKRKSRRLCLLNAYFAKQLVKATLKDNKLL